MSINFPIKLEDDASVLPFLCHMMKMQPLLPPQEDFDLLDESSLVTNIKANIIKYDDVKAICKYEKLGEIIAYFTHIYLNNPNFLMLVFRPVYELQKPYTNKDAIANINCVQNILSSVKTAGLIDQITGQDFHEMTFKCILMRRIDIYIY